MAKKNLTSLKSFLDHKVIEFNKPSFIKEDPVCIPHLFSKKQDIEIAGFFAAVFAWGIRKTIINKSKTLLQLMDHAPYDVCLTIQRMTLKNWRVFVTALSMIQTCFILFRFLNFIIPIMIRWSGPSSRNRRGHCRTIRLKMV